MFRKEFDSKRYEPPLIDLNNRNSSHTLIVELTGHNKTVLEVGTSTGYVSKILRERGNKVVGVEIDPEAASLAKNYCDQVIVGDIENLELNNIFVPSYFDVVIFADVLEHLRWPNIVLEKVKRYLKPDGYLVVSLPNIAHGDIILNLLLGKFKYTELGLLDITHLRFFAIEEIIKLFDQSGYQVADLQTTIVEVGSSEVNIDLTLVPLDVLEFIKGLPYSNVYQFVFKAYPKEYDSVSNISLPKINLTEAFDKFKDSYARKFEAAIREKDVHIANLESALRDKEAYIQLIHSGHGWRLLTKYFKIRNKLLPPGTKRRAIISFILRAIWDPHEILPGLITKENIRKSTGYIKNFGFKAFLWKVKQKLAMKLYMVEIQDEIDVDILMERMRVYLTKRNTGVSINYRAILNEHASKK